MSMLVNKQVIRLQITVHAEKVSLGAQTSSLVDQDSPMNDASFMQVFQAKYNLRHIVLGPLLRQ